MKKSPAFLCLFRVLQPSATSIVLLSILLSAPACRKQIAAKPLPIDEIPKTIQKAFKESTPETSNVVSDVITFVHQDPGKTLEELQILSAQPNLTAEQRQATDRAMYSVLNKLSQSAAKGDKQAEEAMKKYRATK
jgi:hypothetical protein